MLDNRAEQELDKMSKPPRRKFSEEDKRRAVEEYVTGKRSVVNIAEELNVATGLIYKWKSDLELKAKKVVSLI